MGKFFKKLADFFKNLFGKGEKESGFKYSDLLWIYGGMNASNAVEVAKIKDLRVDIANKKMYYRWVSGGCEALGAANRDEYKNTFACIFYYNEAMKKWVGGKFDEVSTSREWRPLANCTNYRGWKWQPFASAGKYAFLIVSKAGDRRTNVIFS